MATASTRTKQAWARGGTVLAATLLLLIGVFQFFVGIAGIAANNFFVVGANYTYEVNITAWGWIHVAIGVIAVITGFFLFTGVMWSRILAIAIAAISAVANFFFLPYYPLWSLLIIAVDIFAIWAVANVRRGGEFEPDSAAMGTGTGMGTDQRSMAGQAQGGQMQGGQMQGGQMQGGQMQGGQMQDGDRWPAENPSQPGRHWAPENVKEGTGQATQPMTDEARERAEAASRGMSQPNTSPPNNPQGGN